MINSSFEQAHFPENWKYAIIKLLIKKVNGEIIKTNFRPVLNLKHLSKNSRMYSPISNNETL